MSTISRGRFTSVGVGTLLALATSGSALADFRDDAVTQTSVSLYGGVFVDGVGTVPSFDVGRTKDDFQDEISRSASPGDAASSVHLAQGTARAAVVYDGSPLPGSGDDAFLLAGAAGYEFLQFDTGSADRARVRYSMTLDGTLRNSAADGYAKATFQFGVYDVTDVAEYFERSPDGDSIHPSAAAFDQEIERKQMLAVAEGSEWDHFAQLGPIYDSAFGVKSQDGSFVPVEIAVDGQFTVFPDRTYLVALSANADLFSPEGAAATADFGNTGHLVFTGLDGAEFQSASGVFLVSAVPEPAALSLLALAGATLFRRQRRA